MRTIVLIALLIAATYACNHNGNDMLLISGLTMGTTYSVKIKNDPPDLKNSPGLRPGAC